MGPLARPLVEATPPVANSREWFTTPEANSPDGVSEEQHGTSQAPQLQRITITATDVILTPDGTTAEQLPRLVELQPVEGAKVQATPTRLKCLKAHWKEDGTRVFAADAGEALQHIAPQD